MNNPSETNESLGNQEANALPSYRMQTAMVLFAIEEALGNYVLELSDGINDIPDKILKNVSVRGGDRPDLNTIVQSTYLSELLDIAVVVSENRGEYEHIKRLRELISALDTFSIRNAVCHPNRPFPECFWHRVAAIATDQTVDALSFKTVVNSFRSAQEGKIISPPEDWLQESIWSLPNNLPKSFEHEITGLVGRQDEVKWLNENLKNIRFAMLAVVGPGGAGKTALCLEVLQKISISPSSTEWVDEIVFVTAKTERLTPRGVEAIEDPKDSLEEIKETIRSVLAESVDDQNNSSFDSLKESFATRRILICIDNLETLLLEHFDEFDEFSATLPPNWRILVTSRIPIDARTRSIEPMPKQGAKILARNYVRSKGGEKFEEGQLENLVEICDCNPLAIRLTIDSFLAGADLKTALSQTKDSITQFSYTALLENLPEAAIDTIECLFAVGEPLSRSEICNYLEKTIDEVAEAISKLLRTTLIVRHSEENSEKYSLSSSVRYLLLKYPMKEEIRNTASQKRREQRKLVGLISAEGENDPLRVQFIPPDTSDHFKALAIKAFRAINRKNVKGHSEVIDILKECENAIQGEPDNPTLHRIRACLLISIPDRHEAMNAFRQSIKSRNGDPASSLALAEYLKSDQQHEEAYELTECLINDGWADPQRTSLKSTVRLLKTHWTSAIRLSEYVKAIDASKHWRDAGQLSTTLCWIYVMALRRSKESEKYSSVIEQTINELVESLNEILDNSGYVGFLVAESVKTIRQISFWCRHHTFDKSCNVKVTQFLDKHLLSIVKDHREVSIDDEEVKAWIKQFGDLKCGNVINMMQSHRWHDIITDKEDQALADYGYIPAKIYYIPQGTGQVRKNFIFGKSKDGVEYYIAKRATSFSEDEFFSLDIGDTVFVLPLEDNGDGKAVPIKDAVLN